VDGLDGASGAPEGLPRWWEQGGKGEVDGRAARAAYGGDATRAASAWKHRAGDTNRPTRQTPAKGRVRAGLGSCCHLEQGLERQTGKGQGPRWFVNRRQKITPHCRRE
jgi:hypothetical protein